MSSRKHLENLKPWKPGQSGNPSGRPVCIITAAYKRLLLKKLLRFNPDGTLDLNSLKPKKGDTSADAIAKGQISKAIQGDTKAAIEVADRTGGKATQRFEVAPDLEGIKAIEVSLRIVKADTPR